MADQATGETLRLRVGPFACELDATSIKIGRVDVRYEDITGFGVGVVDPSVGVGGVRIRKVGMLRHYLLFIAYQSGGKARHVGALVGGDEGMSPDGVALVNALRARAPDRWVGERPHLEIRERLGISNAPVVLAVVGAIAVALLITAGIVIYAVQSSRSAHGAHSPRPPAAAQKR